MSSIKDLIKTFESVLEGRDNKDKSKLATSTALKNVIQYLYQDKTNYRKYRMLNNTINGYQDTLLLIYDENRSYLNETSLFDDIYVLRYVLDKDGKETEVFKTEPETFLPEVEPQDIMKWLDLKCKDISTGVISTNFDRMTLRLGDKVSFALDEDDLVEGVNDYISKSSNNFINYATFKSQGYWEHLYKSIKKDTDDPLPVSGTNSYYPSTLNGYTYESIRERLLTKFVPKGREPYVELNGGVKALVDLEVYALLTLVFNGLQTEYPNSSIHTANSIDTITSVLSTLDFNEDVIGVLCRNSSEYYLVQKSGTNYLFGTNGGTSWQSTAPIVNEDDTFQLFYQLPAYTDDSSSFVNPFNAFYKALLDNKTFIEYVDLEPQYKASLENETQAITNWNALKSGNNFNLDYSFIETIKELQPNFLNYAQINSKLGSIVSTNPDKLNKPLTGTGLYKKRFELLYLRLHKTDGSYAKAVAAEIGKYSMNSMNSFSEDSNEISKQYETAIKLIDYRIDNKKDTFLLECKDYELYLDPNMTDASELPTFMPGNSFYFVYTDINMTKNIKEFNFVDLDINVNVTYKTHIMDMNYKEDTYIDGILVPNMRPTVCYALKLNEDTDKIARDEDAILGIVKPPESSTDDPLGNCWV